jgi:hypothetical protein
MFPAGRARLAMKPDPTGSLDVAMTTGIVDVACLTAAITGFPGGATTTQGDRLVVVTHDERDQREPAHRPPGAFA